MASLALVIYGFVAAATPILLYIFFNRESYTLYESGFVRDFCHPMQSGPFPTGIKPSTSSFGTAFSPCRVLAFLSGYLSIPLPYYWLLGPGAVLALWQKHFEIPLLATIPVIGAFIAKAIENRLLLPIHSGLS